MFCPSLEGIDPVWIGKAGLGEGLKIYVVEKDGNCWVAVRQTKDRKWNFHESSGGLDESGPSDALLGVMGRCDSKRPLELVPRHA